MEHTLFKMMKEITFFIFLKKKDDASRYAMLLEEESFPDMHVIEVDPDMMMSVCETHGYEYTVITPNDIVIPPSNKSKPNDFI